MRKKELSLAVGAISCNIDEDLRKIQELTEILSKTHIEYNKGINIGTISYIGIRFENLIPEMLNYFAPFEINRIQDYQKQLEEDNFGIKVQKFNQDKIDEYYKNKSF